MPLAARAPANRRRKPGAAAATRRRQQGFRRGTKVKIASEVHQDEPIAFVAAKEPQCKRIGPEHPAMKPIRTLRAEDAVPFP